MKWSIYLIGIMIMSLVVLAGPPMPAPVVFGFTHNGEPIVNFQVELRVGDESVKKITNNLGLIGIDVGTGSPDFGEIDIRVAKLKLICGFDVCNKEYVIYDISDVPFITSFELTERPPVTCPACDCNCGSSSGCYVSPQECTETQCQEVVCKDTVCAPETTQECVFPPCTPEQCEDTICDTCPDPEGENIGALIIYAIGLLIVGGASGIYFTKNKALGKRGGIKVYVGNDGKEKTVHKHPGIKGYHDPYTEHRDQKERHPRGQLFPHYERDNIGEWAYVE